MLGPHLRVMVTTLIPFVQRKEPRMRAEVIALLQSLISDDNEKDLKDAIVALDPFPETPAFRELNQVYYRYI